MTPLALQLAALDEDKVTPGLLGFTVVAILAVATWVLLRSMNKQLKRVDFEEKDVPGDDGGPGAGGMDGSDGTRGPGGAAAAGTADMTGTAGPAGVAGMTDVKGVAGAGDAEAGGADDAGSRETQAHGAR